MLADVLELVLGVHLHVSTGNTVLLEVGLEENEGGRREGEEADVDGDGALNVEHLDLLLAATTRGKELLGNLIGVFLLKLHEKSRKTREGGETGPEGRQERRIDPALNTSLESPKPYPGMK